MLLLTWIAKDVYGGWFRPYPFLIFFGFLLAIVLAFWGFYRRNIPNQSLYVGIFVITPVALFGASFFGKLGDPIPFYVLFEFWQPGLSIHGGLIFGLLFGLVWFSFYSRKTNISLWVYADLIVPHILLAQAVGRWGNFFNHELLGQRVSRASLSWLPNFIRDNLFKWAIPQSGDSFDYQQMAVGWANGHPYTLPTDFNNVYYYAPLFLYESIACLLLWVLIVIVIPKIFRYSYYCRFKKAEPEFNRLSFKGVWDKWYYDIVPDQIVVGNISTKENLKKILFKNSKRFSTKKKIKVFWRYIYLIIKRVWFSNSKKLEQLENPHQLKVLRCGTQFGCYITGYSVIRLGLETQRDKIDLFLINQPVANYIVLSFFIILGIVLIIFSQFIAVNKWRQGGWLYEKQY